MADWIRTGHENYSVNCGSFSLFVYRGSGGSALRNVWLLGVTFSPIVAAGVREYPLRGCTDASHAKAYAEQLVKSCLLRAAEDASRSIP